MIVLTLTGHAHKAKPDGVNNTNKNLTTYNLSSSTLSSSSLFGRPLPPPRSVSLGHSSRGPARLALASSTKGLTKAMRLVQQWQSGWKSSASCSLLRGVGSLDTCSSSVESTMPREEAFRSPRRISTGRRRRKRKQQGHRIGNKQINGKWTAFIQCFSKQWPLKALNLQYCLKFPHSCTHSHTDGGVSHARRQPAHLEQSGCGVLLRDTSTPS